MLLMSHHYIYYQVTLQAIKKIFNSTTLYVLTVHGVDFKHHSNTPFVYTMEVHTKCVSEDSEHLNVSGMEFLYFGHFSTCPKVLSLVCKCSQVMMIIV